jgi:hypothetical protein
LCPSAQNENQELQEQEEKKNERAKYENRKNKMGVQL